MKAVKENARKAVKKPIRSAIPTLTGMKMMSVRLPKQLIQDIKIIAVDQSVTMELWITTMLGRAVAHWNENEE